MVEAGGEMLQGELLDAETGLTVFRGIPFAAPPTGEGRWRPPEPHSPRTGLQDATQFGPACPQLQGNPEFYRFVAGKFGASADVVPPMLDISEDCLYLNVWTRHARKADKRPVMVWIYGGGNRNGYAQEPEYLGDRLAERDVVYVSLNYRVGALGFLAHPGLSAESREGVSGNYGILDQITALNWVKRNIAAFGGDPDNMTVFGESAGAANTATLIASPLAAGLFQHAISQSGGYPADIFYTLKDAEATGRQIAEQLGLEDPENPAASVEALRSASWESLVQGAEDVGAPYYTEVNIDGWLMPASLAEIYERGRVNDVDLMIGVNRNENYAWVTQNASAEDLAESLRNFASPYREGLEAALQAQSTLPIRKQIDRLTSASDFVCPSLFMANAMAKNGFAVYFYYFTRVRPGAGSLLAYHGAEISYTHDTAYEWLPANETDRRLTDIMGQFWVNFAATGSPNGDGLPQWPEFTAETGEYLELGDTIEPGAGLEADFCSVLDRLRDSRM